MSPFSLFLIPFHMLIQEILFFCPCNSHHHKRYITDILPDIHCLLTFSIQDKRCCTVSWGSLHNTYWLFPESPLTSFQALVSTICSNIDIIADVFLGVKFCSSHILHFLSCFFCIFHFAFPFFFNVRVFFPHYVF